MQLSQRFTAQEIIDSAGITGVQAHKTGRQYTQCPGCSSGRKGFNRKSKCLAVNIDDKGVRWFCNHCPTFQGGKLFEGGGYDPQAPHRPGSISSRAMPRPPVNGYAMMQRSARHSWR